MPTNRYPSLDFDLGAEIDQLRDTVRAFLPEHDVWVTDWVDARLVPLSAGPFHLAGRVAR